MPNTALGDELDGIVKSKAVDLGVKAVLAAKPGFLPVRAVSRGAPMG